MPASSRTRILAYSARHYAGFEYSRTISPCRAERKTLTRVSGFRTLKRHSAGVRAQRTRGICALRVNNVALAADWRWSSAHPPSAALYPKPSRNVRRISAVERPRWLLRPCELASEYDRGAKTKTRDDRSGVPTHGTGRLQTCRCSSVTSRGVTVWSSAVS